MTEDSPMKLTVSEMLDLKVVFKCAPVAKGGDLVLIKESLIRITYHSPLIERMIRDGADSVTDQGAPLDAHTIPAYAARAVLDVLLNVQIGDMLREVNLYTPFGQESLERAPSCFDWVDEHTYRFLDMFEFDALRKVVDMFISKFPTMDTIAARDAVSPTDASWATSREVAKVAEFVFYDDPTEERSSACDHVENYLTRLSPALLARVLTHISFGAKFRINCHNRKEQIVSISRLYDPGNWSQAYVNLFVEEDDARHLFAGGPGQGVVRVVPRNNSGTDMQLFASLANH